LDLLRTSAGQIGFVFSIRFVFSSGFIRVHLRPSSGPHTLQRQLPKRLDVCRVPRVLQREIQYVDLIPDSSAGVQKLVATMRRELKRWAVW
jgi:hypothetical protein